MSDVDKDVDDFRREKLCEMRQRQIESGGL